MADCEDFPHPCSLIFVGLGHAPHDSFLEGVHHILLCVEFPQFGFRCSHVPGLDGGPNVSPEAGRLQITSSHFNRIQEPSRRLQEVVDVSGPSRNLYPGIDRGHLALDAHGTDVDRCPERTTETVDIPHLGLTDGVLGPRLPHCIGLVLHVLKSDHRTDGPQFLLRLVESPAKERPNG